MKKLLFLMAIAACNSSASKSEVSTDSVTVALPDTTVEVVADTCTCSPCECGDSCTCAL